MKTTIAVPILTATLLLSAAGGFTLRAAEGPEPVREKPALHEPERRPDQVRGDGEREARARRADVSPAGRRDGDQPGEARPEAGRDQMRPRPEAGNPVPPEVRRQHLRAAIENLHAAGMHELADRLGREVERDADTARAAGLRPESRGELRGPMMRDGGVDTMRAEIQELRQGMRELRAQMEALKREQPKPER